MAPLPEFDPRMSVPDGLEEWIHRLMAKLPRDRFQYAADAAWALVNLSGPTEQDTQHTITDRLVGMSSLIDGEFRADQGLNV